MTEWSFHYVQGLAPRVRSSLCHALGRQQHCTLCDMASAVQVESAWVDLALATGQGNLHLARVGK